MKSIYKAVGLPGARVVGFEWVDRSFWRWGFHRDSSGRNGWFCLYSPRLRVFAVL